MAVKLIALDLDGTTLNSEGRLSGKNRQALEKAIEKDINVVIATGRCYAALPREISEIHGIQYAITSNGAQVRDLRSGGTLLNRCIDSRAVEAAADILARYPYMVEVFTDGKAYLEKKDYEKIVSGGNAYRRREYVMETRNPVDGAMDFMLAHKDAIENINIFFDDQKEKAEMRGRLETIENVTLTSSLDNNWEIGGRYTSKASALAELCRILDVEKDEIMACGDSPNDGDMLREAGIPVAVGNAKDVIKELAVYVAGSNDEDGVAEAVERFALAWPANEKND